MSPDATGDFLYRKLVRALLAELASGLYPEHSRFISNRKIRRLWKVSEPTATSGLHWLVNKGLLTARPRSGYYVARQGQKKALVLLHGQTSTGLSSPMTWDLKRYQLAQGGGHGTRRIAVIVAGILSRAEALSHLPPPGTEHDLVLESARSIFREATRQKCSVHFYMDDGHAERRSVIVDRLLKQKPDGVIAFRRLPSYAPLQAMVAPILAARIPVVTVFDDCEGLNVLSLNINNVGLGYDVVRRFLRMGHRRVAILLPKVQSPYFQDRAVGGRMAVSEARLPNASLEVLQLPRFRPIPPSMARRFHDPKQRPTALFVTAASLFASLWPLLRQLKLAVPRDISIIMAAGDTYVPGCKRSFDTMKINFPDIGKLALSSLIALLEGHLAQRTNVLAPRYISQGSVRRIP